jgi:tetratricopeptide (TPR) repeat protein
LETAQKLLKISPASAYANFLLARILVSSGDFGQALEILNSIPQPTADIISLRDKITIYRAENTAELEKQIAAGIRDPSLFGRLCILYRTSEPVKALENCRRAHDIEPDNLGHAVGYGAALVQARQYADAVSLFRRILVIAPDNFTAHANLATALFQIKSYKEAIAEYVWIINRKPDLPIAYYFLAIAHDNLEEYTDALANYQKFLKIADEEQNQLEIDKVMLRVPGVQSLIKQGKGRKNE